MKKFIFFFLGLAGILQPAISMAYDRKPHDKFCVITHDGIKRTYILHVPATLDKNKSISLIIALHGRLGTARKMKKLTLNGFNALADRENFIVAYPNGIERNWNNGRRTTPDSYKVLNRSIDDVGFISTLIDEIVKNYNADPKRVYVTGMSNGAMMTQRLAIELGDKITAAASVCGNIPLDLKSKPRNTVAMMIINGTQDPLVPYDGGDVHFLKKKLGKVTSTNETIMFWVKNNKITATPVITDLTGKNTSEGCHVKKTAYGLSSDAGEVVLISVEGGGHTWPGGWQYLGEKWIGKTCSNINACQVIWDFFKMHSK